MERVRVLEQIDMEGLSALAEGAKEQPESGRRTLKARTVCEGEFRNLSYIRNQEPVVIDEPCQLLGTDTAPNPSEVALAALGSCISVGLMANAVARGIKLEEISLELEGDIDTSPVWGVGDLSDEKVPGFTAVRVKVHLGADASAEELADLEQHAMVWSPVVNTFRRPVEITSELVTD